MNKIMLAAALLSVVAFGAHAADPVKAGAALSGKELAAAVAKVMPLDQQINDFTESMSQNLPVEKRPLFKSIMKKNIDADKLRIAATDALQKTYTEAELHTMYDFYSKPESQVIMSKLSNFGKLMQPTVETMVQKAAVDAQKAGLFPPAQ